MSNKLITDTDKAMELLNERMENVKELACNEILEETCILVANMFTNVSARDLKVLYTIESKNNEQQ